MASVFKKDVVVQEKSVIEVVRESLDVDSGGAVRFRSRVGRGSGKAVEIPGGQFDEFVTLMVQAQESRETLAEQQRVVERPVDYGCEQHREPRLPIRCHEPDTAARPLLCAGSRSPRPVLARRRDRCPDPYPYQPRR